MILLLSDLITTFYYGQLLSLFKKKQGRKRPLDTPKRMIERRERRREKERES